MGIKVSVIIPVFNGSSYLRECLDSVLGQTLEEIEVICVDDGSTDSSYEILCEYQQRDNRVKVLRQHNQFAGAARNLGMDHAAGDYLLFLDADDFFEADMLRLAFDRAQASDADIVLFAGRRYDDRKSSLSTRTEFLNSKLIPDQPCFTGRDVPGDIFQITNPAPWSKLFRAGFVRENGLKFQALQNTNDLFFSFAALAVAERIVALSAEESDFVRYRINTGKNTQANKDIAPTCFLDAFCALEEYLSSRGVFDFYYRSFCKAALSCAEYVLKSVKSDGARDSILEALSEERFCELGVWDVSDENLHDSAASSRRVFLRAAVAQHRKALALENKEKLGVSSRARILQRAEVKPVLSVVVPVYNAVEYVGETLDSVLSCSGVELEVVCVNDGSTDSSLELLLERASVDRRVTVVDKANGGVSDARNVGVGFARGKYIMFLDSDDYLAPDCLPSLIARMAEFDLDLLFYSGRTVFDSTDMESDFQSFADRYQRSGIYDDVYSGPALFEKMWNSGEYYSCSSMFVVRRSFLDEEELRFLPGVLHEDNAFTFACILAAKRASCVIDQVYMRRIRPASIVTSQVSFANSHGYYFCHEAMQRTYCQSESQLSLAQRSAAKEVVASMLAASCRDYANMPKSDIGSEYGLGLDYRAFCRLVKNPAMRVRSSEEKIAHKDAQIAELKKKQSAAERSLKKVKKSRSYRLARMIAFPVRAVRSRFSKRR